MPASGFKALDFRSFMGDKIQVEIAGAGNEIRAGTRKTAMESEKKKAQGAAARKSSNPANTENARKDAAPGFKSFGRPKNARPALEGQKERADAASKKPKSAEAENQATKKAASKKEECPEKTKSHKKKAATGVHNAAENTQKAANETERKKTQKAAVRKSHNSANAKNSRAAKARAQQEKELFSACIKLGFDLSSLHSGFSKGGIHPFARRPKKGKKKTSYFALYKMLLAFLDFHPNLSAAKKKKIRAIMDICLLLASGAN